MTEAQFERHMEVLEKIKTNTDYLVGVVTGIGVGCLGAIFIKLLVLP